MNILDIIKSLIDVGLVTFLFYKLITVVQGTRAIEILKGVAVIVIIWVLSGVFGLDTLKFIFSQLLLYGLLGVMIIFQPELRNALEKIGKRNLGSRFTSQNEPTTLKIINDIVKASEYMSERKIGALINIEMNDSLYEYIKTGIKLDSEISKELLINIFTPNVPLHDGALILKDGRIASASCYLPLTSRDDIPKELGTRHRAGIGLSEATDAITVIVSEETGKITFVRGSDLFRGITTYELKAYLDEHLIQPPSETKRKPLFWRFGA